MKLTNRFLSYLIVLLQSSIYGMSPDGVKPNQAQLRDAPMPTQSVMNINNMAYWITKSTGGTTSGSQNGTQADYPIGTGGLIYEDGMLWGVKVTDGNSQSPRVGGTTYYDGLKAGRVIYNDDGNVIGSTDPANHHVWRVRRDYLTADLYSDAASFYGTTEPSENEIQNVFDQYEYDWNNWPADWGAPFEDVDGNGTYNPAVDIPGYQGASQTLWVVANDVPIIVDDSGNVTGEINTAPTVYGADPIGIELQVTLWAYNYGATAPLGNVLFKHVQMQYTGLTEGYNNFNSAIAHLDTVYFTQWSDPDLGTYTDDYVGYDLNHSLGYVYNSTNQDDMFNDYGVSVPSGGYDFLQGPEVEGEFLPVTAFSYFGAGSEIYDPDLSSYAGTLQFFNLMEGFLPRPYYPNQEPWIDITTGEITKFVLTGDPLTGEGWVDGIQLPPGDRRMVMTSGPFAMEIGETQEIVLALIGGHGSDNLTSISVLKYHDQFAQYAYDTNYDLPEAPITPIVSVSPLDTAIILNWNENAELVESHSSVGFEFQGYNVYQLPVEYSSIDDGERITTFDIIDYVQTIFDLALDEETGYIYRIPVQFGTNSGLQRYYTVDWDHINNQPLQPGQEYYFAVTAYSFNDDSNEQMPFCTLESSFTLIAESLQIVPEYDYGDEIVSIGHSGTAGGTGVTIDIISPDQLTGHDYEVFFDLQHYYRDLGGFWQMTNYPDSVGRVLGKTLDCSGSSIGVAALASETIGTIDLVLTYDMVCPSGAWVDGLQVDLPDDMVINSWDTVAGCSYPEYGQNCVNMEGTLEAGNVITWGDSARSTFGAIESGQILVVNIQSYDTFPFDVGYQVWDDGYDGTIVDGIGTSTVTELGYEFKTIKHWNLQDLTTGATILEDQTVLNGIQQEAVIDGELIPAGMDYGTAADPIVDGFQIHVDVLYVSPINYESISDGGVWYGSESYTIGSYYDYGWASTAKSIDTYGAGFTEVDYLQRDVKVVWDGVYGEPDANGYVPVVEGGSQAWLYGARMYDISAHLDPNNPGTGDPFLVTVPFKVYDMETIGGGDPVQIGIIIYDRVADPAVTPFYAFNPAGRMYTEFVLRPYEETLADFASNEAFLTWNTVWWGSPYTAGDEILFVYANPIQQGVDTYSFTTTAPAEFTIAKGDVNNDGDVNISDVVMLINYLLQISDLETDAQMYAADHNGDYAINIADAVSIIQDILNRSGKLLASTSPAENSLISLSETAIIYENEIQLPMTLTADGDISALQVELTYDHQILVPDTPVLNGGSWNDINVLYTSSQPGKVIYLFYSLGGSTLPIAEDLIFPFRNITGDENVSTKISLTQAVVAGSNGRSTVLEYGNRTAKTNAVPETYSLYPNYPNPFNPVTNIEFDLPEVSLVTIHVYNILGQQVRTLIDGNKIAGHHRIQWDGRNTYGESLASGVYFVRFKANEFLQNQKIMLLK